MSASKTIFFQRRKLGWLIGGMALLVILTACGTRTTIPTPRSPVTAPTSPEVSPTVSATSASAETGPLPAIPLEQGDWSRGERLFSSVGCIGCHTIKDVGGNVGPDLTQVASRAPSRAAAQGLKQPELYFVQSVVYPKAYVVEGFSPVMPNWKEMQLTEKDLADIVAYLKTLTGE